MEKHKLINLKRPDNVHDAVADPRNFEKVGGSMADDLQEIAERFSQLPVLSQASEDEILGYDEFGAPTR